MLRLSLLLASVMAVSTSTAGGAQCPVDTVPIQITDDARRNSDIIFSTANLSDPHFRAFVTAVTEHVTTRLVADKHCTDRAKIQKRSLLQFVNWPLIPPPERTPTQISSLDARPSGGCRISSPWIDLVVDRTPILSIRGVIRWNQRQLLADQAVLAEGRNVSPGVAMPLMNREVGGFIAAYEDSELLHELAAKPIEERVPPDILWLLRHSWQSTRAPFIGYVTSAMEKATEMGAEGYTKLVISLIDRCFASDKTDVHYSSILDVADLISLEQYKIDKLTY